MQPFLSKIAVGCLGMCVGFTLSYLNSTGLRMESKATVITIAHNGEVVLGTEQPDLHQLSAHLKQQAVPGKTITICANANADFNRVAAVVDACQTAGLSRIALRTSAPE